MNLYSWQRLRKSTLLLFILLLVFAFIQIFQLTESESSQAEPLVTNLELMNSGIVCHNVVDQKPFGPDSIFKAGQERVYFYTDKAIGVQSFHIWYFGTDTIYSQDCESGDSICVSYLRPNSSQKGHWSVDHRSGHALLQSAQFQVIP
jgi:hypothetical protein